jgi:hypothetical protein
LLLLSLFMWGFHWNHWDTLELGKYDETKRNMLLNTHIWLDPFINHLTDSVATSSLMAKYGSF